MTAPEMESIIAATLDKHPRIMRQSLHQECLCGWVGKVLGYDHPAHQARAVLAALGEAGTVQFGVRWHVGGCSGINRCTSKRHAERQAAKLIESGHEAAVVSRLTLPWAAVRPENPTKAWRMQHEPDAYFAEARKLAKAEAERQIREETNRGKA